MGFKSQFNLVNRSGVIAQPAHNAGVNRQAIFAIAKRCEQRRHIAQFREPLLPQIRIAHEFCHGVERVVSVFGVDGDHLRHFVDLLWRQLGALGKIAAVIFAAIAQKRFHRVEPKPVHFIHGAQNRQPRGLIIFCCGVKPDGDQQPIHNFTIVNPHHIIAPLEP